MVKRVNLRIYGWVQGVFFRDSSRRKARKLGLVGWVKNEPDNAVKIVAQGEEKDLKEFIKWCYNGSMLARVDNVEIEWSEPKEEFEGFEIR